LPVDLGEHSFACLNAREEIGELAGESGIAPGQVLREGVTLGLGVVVGRPAPSLFALVLDLLLPFGEGLDRGGEALPTSTKGSGMGRQSFRVVLIGTRVERGVFRRVGLGAEDGSLVLGLQAQSRWGCSAEVIAVPERVG
jgi:hypothetical protein